MNRIMSAALALGLLGAVRYTATRPDSLPVAVTAATIAPDSAKPATANTPLPPFEGGRRLLTAACGGQWAALVMSGHCGRRLRTLIVTMPDPYESRLDWSYDADMEAMRRAIEAAGYVIDRFDLPGAGDVVAARGAQYVVDGTSVPRRAVDPGVMLFRPRDWNRQELLLVYVIGEVPTYGVHKDALRRAIAERATLLAQVQHADTTINIVGPIFSGSVASFAVALRGVRPRISMISGSATDEGNARVLRAALPDIDYRTTLHSDAMLNSVLDTFVLPRLLRNRDAVAFLCDCTTVYDPASASNRRVAPFRRLVIPFPVNIAGFRASYQKQKTAAEDPRTAMLTAPGDRVNLDINKLAQAQETPRSISEATPASVDIVMREIVNTLRRNRVRAVVIHATDVRDKLFLAQVIREELRDVQLITFESNVLFQRGEFDNALRGMLVLSSYPIILENQDWTFRPGDSRVPFSSETAAGIYNAVAIALGRGDLLTEYGMPGDSAREGQRPPVWLTVIGSHSALPVTARRAFRDFATTDKQSSGAAAEVNVTRAAVADPHDVNFAWTVLLLTLLSASAYFSIMTLNSKENIRPPGVCRDALSRETVPVLYPDLYAFLSLVAILAMIAPVTLLLIRYTSGFMHGALIFLVFLALSLWIVALVTTATTLLAGERFRIGSVLTDFFSYVLRETHYPGSWRWLEVGARLALLILGLGLLGMIGLQLYEVYELSEIELRIMAYRAFQIDSGVSPLLPTMLMAAGLFVWCAWHRGRVRELREGTAFEEMMLERPRPTRDEWMLRGGLPQVQQAVIHIRRRLVFIAPVRSSILVAALLFIVSIWILYHTRGSIERLVLTNARLPLSKSVAFDWIFRGAIISMLCVGTWAVLRLIVTWTALHKLLGGLVESPVIWSLSALPHAMRQRVRPTLISLRKSARPLGHLANTQWRAMQHSVGPDVQIPGEEAPLMAAVSRVPQRELWWEQRRPAAEMGDDLSAVYDALDAFWVDDPLRVAWRPNDDKARDTYFAWRLSPPLMQWRRHAEEFVAGQVVYYIEWTQAQLRRIAFFLLASLVISIALVSSYPFQPQSVVQALLAILFVAAMGSIILITIQMNKDPVVSALSGNDPGVLNWNRDFMLNLLLFIGLPTLTMLSARFPAVRDVVFAWAEPLIRSLAKF